MGSLRLATLIARLAALTRPATPRHGRLREVRAEMDRRPDHEGIVAGRGSGGALPATASHERNNGAAPQQADNGTALRPPNKRQLACWKAIDQA